MKKIALTITVLAFTLFLLGALTDVEAATTKEILAAEIMVGCVGGFDGKAGITHPVPESKSICRYLQDILGPDFLVINLAEWEATIEPRQDFARAANYCYSSSGGYYFSFSIPFICPEEKNYYHEPTIAWRGIREQLWTLKNRYEHFSKINPALQFRYVVWTRGWDQMYSNAFGTDQYRVPPTVYSELAMMQINSMYRDLMLQVNSMGATNIVVNMPSYQRLFLALLLYSEKAAHRIDEPTYTKGIRQLWNSLTNSVPGSIRIANHDWLSSNKIYPKKVTAVDLATRIAGHIAP